MHLNNRIQLEARVPNYGEQAVFESAEGVLWQDVCVEREPAVCLLSKTKGGVKSREVPKVSRSEVAELA